jgi:hypothetical protein
MFMIRVKYGFKAPVAMTLLPWWLEVTEKLLFIHVLRDGRDIAFSANQGPVNKFYVSMYKNVMSQVPTGSVAEKAIKLWADWNNDIRKWAENKIKNVREKKVAKSKEFDYLSVHIEDLVDTSDIIRLNAIAYLAKFVGSSKYILYL